MKRVIVHHRLPPGGSSVEGAGEHDREAPAVRRAAPAPVGPIVIQGIVANVEVEHVQRAPWPHDR